MIEWNVIMSPDAETELQSIQSYIANTLLVPDTATKQTRRILDSVKELSNMPKKFSPYEKEPWYSRGVRKQPVDNFVVLYWPNEKTKEVVILHIFYGGQNIDNILKKETMHDDSD